MLGRTLENKTITDFLRLSSFKGYSLFFSTGAGGIEKYNQTIRSLPQKPVSEKGIANWVNELDAVTKKSKKTKHSWANSTPIQASSKINEGNKCQKINKLKKENTTKV